MRRYYSRLAKVEEKRNVKSAIIFGGLTILFVVFMAFFGLGAITRVLGVLFDIKGTSTPIQKTDTTPPPPPILTNIPDQTNQDKLTISGNTEEGATVRIYINGAKQEVVSDSNGNFVSDVSFHEGDNALYTVAVDKSGNQSTESKHYNVILDKTAPKLTVTDPLDGTTIYGEKKRNVTITGQTDNDSNLTINDRIVNIDDSGNFKYTTNLTDGDNTFHLVSQDKAGNKTELQLKLTFSQ